MAKCLTCCREVRVPGELFCSRCRQGNYDRTRTQRIHRKRKRASQKPQNGVGGNGG